MAKRINLQQEINDEKTLSPNFLSLINKSNNSNENSKYNSSRLKELDDSNKRMTLTNLTPSFKFQSSFRSMNNTVSNINPPETCLNSNLENKKNNEEKDVDVDVVFCKINMQSIKDQTFKLSTDLEKQNSHQILYYGNIKKKSSFGTEFTKLSSSAQSVNQTLYDSKTSHNTSFLFNIKSNTVNDKRPPNVLSK